MKKQSSFQTTIIRLLRYFTLRVCIVLFPSVYCCTLFQNIRTLQTHFTVHYFRLREYFHMVGLVVCTQRRKFSRVELLELLISKMFYIFPLYQFIFSVTPYHIIIQTLDQHCTDNTDMIFYFSIICTGSSTSNLSIPKAYFPPYQ